MIYFDIIILKLNASASLCGLSNQMALEHYVMLYLKNHHSFHFYKFNFLCVACEIAARQAKPSVGPCQFLRL